MRVDKQRIINGFVSYVESEIVPKISDDKAMQIIISVGVNTIKGNSNIANKFFDNTIVSTIAKHEQIDGKNTYDLDGLFSLTQNSISKYGYFPIIFAIPFVSTTEKELKFSSEDIEMLKTYIEEAK